MRQAAEPRSREAEKPNICPPDWCGQYVCGSMFADHGRGEWYMQAIPLRKFDCWGLVRAVLQEQFGIEGLPDYGDAYSRAHDQRSVAAAVQAGLRDGWTKLGLLDEPRAGDIIILRLAGRPWHCGVLAGLDWFLHITEGAGATLEQWTRPLWVNRIEGFYRHNATQGEKHS